MNDSLRSYIMRNFFTDNFFSEKCNNYKLEEREDSGRSILNLEISEMSNLCIENLDDKKTDILFFKNQDASGNKTFLKKRVDHIVFVNDGNDKWNVHLIEMKSGIENIEKWYAIKGKFRASYIISRVLATILHIKINETIMYTTFEHANTLVADKTNPVARRLSVGKPISNPCKEWDGSDFALQFDERIKFIHIPIQMYRNSSGYLEGSYKI